MKAAVGEDTDTEKLGGAATHTEISGIADYKFATGKGMFGPGKKIMGKLGPSNTAGFNRVAPRPPAKNNGEYMGSSAKAMPNHMICLT